MDGSERSARAPIRTLLVEDNPLDVELELEELRSAGLVVEERVVFTEPEYRVALNEFDPNVILCDFHFPSFDGETALRIARTEYPLIPFIFVSGTLSEESLAVAVQNGAVDYIQKSNPVRLPSAVLRALDGAEQKRLLRVAEQRVARLGTIRDVMSAIDRAIVRHRERGELFEEACRIVTEIGGFPIAAIVARTKATSPFAVQASAGLPIGSALEGSLPGLSAGIKRQMGAFVVNDLSNHQSMRKRRELWDAGVRSMGAFPLTVKGETIGAMVMATNDVGFFNEEEIALLTDVASNLSFALGYISEQHRVLRLSRIRDVLAAVNETIVRVTDSETLYREVCRIAFEVAGYLSVFVATVDETLGHPRVASAAGSAALHEPMLERALMENVRTGRGLVSPTLHTLRPAVVNDLSATGRATLHLPLGAGREGVVATGAFPLVVEGRAIGAVVFDSAEAGYFDDEEVALLTNLTSNVSFALDHIRRRERLGRLSRLRDVLSAVNVAIVRLRDRSELCQEACRIAVDVGGFSNALLAELDPASGRVTIPYFEGPFSAPALDDGGLRNSLITASIETSQPVLKSNVPRPDPSPSREELELDGIRAIGSFPIVVEQKAVGAMVFETEVRGYFDAEEVALLINLMDNLAFGLNLIEKQQLIDYQAYYDVLTQLPNRTLFYDRLGRDIAACKEAGKALALAIVDINRFSVLNNTLGENVGDEALRQIATRLREAVDENRIARVGGDKFAVYFPMLDDLTPAAAFIAEGEMLLFEKPFTIQGHEVHITARAGCAVFPADGSGPEELFQNAEAALAGAKRSGATYRFYAPELNVRLAKLLDLEARLRRAIDEQQFVVYYQPKVELTGRKIVGFEGLLRWNDPERGLVAPGAFIPLLERSGMIIPVGRWALLEAARQYEEWRRAGLNPPRIAMNLSAVQMRQDGLIDDVRAALALFENGCGLDLEVTESMLFENIEAAAERLREIKALGPRISLDDFGTGYSSLSYIHQLPLNALKIDRSFIIGMYEDVNKRSIVSTIISLGDALNLKTIAEGVETKQDADLLELLKCDQMQGFLVSKPVPADQASRFLLT
jgi:diguanylate cyclase (GGDEF)-like protein